MNPIRAFKIYLRAQKLVRLFQRAFTSAQGTAMSKSLFASKTFWINALSLGLELTQVLPIPSGTLLITTNIINIALRALTDQPVHLIKSKE